jgi:hypothetical protein
VGCVDCYGCFARAAPGKRELNLRPPAVGLLRPGAALVGELAFVVFMLASVTYDGLLATPLWVSGMFVLQSLMGSFGLLSSLFFGTVGLIMVPLLFFCLYAGFVKLCQAMGGGAGFWKLAGTFAYTLVPIALAYQAAHYSTLLITEGQNLISLFSDPFGWGWDLFGTAGYEVNVNVLGQRPSDTRRSPSSWPATSSRSTCPISSRCARPRARSSPCAARSRWLRSWCSTPLRASGSSPSPSWSNALHDGRLGASQKAGCSVSHRRVSFRIGGCET